MKLIKVQKLHFQNDKSDKVYEVELYELQPNEFIVNFRYGRRGSKLTEGTKTVMPVPKEKAEKLFNSLVQSKTKKGYQEVDSYDDQIIVPLPRENGDSDKDSTILNHLRRFSEDGTLPENWPLSRIVWRAGELKLAEAIPYMPKVLKQPGDMDVYAAVWYLGRMGNSECLPILQDISVKNKDLHFHIHTAALIRCKDEKTIQDVANQLPGSLKELYQHRKWNDYAAQIQQIIHELKPQNVDFILHTYLLSIAESGLKPALFPILSQIQLKPGYWKIVRRIFKIAEMVDDYGTLGILAANIQRKKPFFHQNSWGEVYANNRWVIPSKELPKPDSSLAFSDKTRNYFIRRVIRNLYKAGNDQLESYCDYAAQILINYTEKDKINHPPDRRYNWNRETRQYNITETIYHKLGHIPFIYHILYAGGDRLIIPKKGKFRFEAGEVEQIKREEPFAALWNKYPGYAVEILSKSQLKEGVDFALRILKGREDILDLISVNHVISMLSSPFEEVLRFALEYIQNNAELFQRNVEFFIPAVLTNFESLHQWLRKNVSEGGFKEEEKQRIIAETFVAFRQIEGEDVLGLPVETLMHCFPDFLSKLDVSYILSLFEEENLQLHLLAGRLLNLNQISLADLPPDLLTRMLHSSSEEVRAQGVNLLHSLSAEDLRDKEELFISLATSSESDLRQAAKELIGRLAVNNQDLRDKIFLNLYPILLKNTEIEGLHQDVYSIISTHLHPSIPLILPEIDVILKDNHRETHLMTSDFLTKYVDLNSWPVYRIALMGNHDMKEIREMAWKYYRENSSRMKYEKEEAIQLLDSDWDETRDFAEKYFDEHFSENEWEPELIISLCDNVRPEVQEYGTRVLGRYFKDEYGVKYLLALSEHPDPVIQLYTTNYLDRYAFNHLERLKQLEFYFRSILTSINIKRVAKERVFHFLAKQVKEGENYGRFVSAILNDVVATISIKDKARCMIILNEINKRYPDIKTRLKAVPIEVRSK